MDNSPLPGIPGIPIIPREKIPNEIGTEVCFIRSGKIFVGLIREFINNDEIILQCGHSMLQTIKFSQIIGFTKCPKKICEHTLNVSVSKFEEHNKTIVNCVSQQMQNINGVIFYNQNQK